jgi:hypothetical protein
VLESKYFFMWWYIVIGQKEYDLRCTLGSTS